MDTPIIGEKPKRPITAWIWIGASLTVTVCAFFYDAALLHKFYIDTAALAPGTGIRPMFLAAITSLTALASIIFGGIFAVIAGIIGLIRHRWPLVFCALLTAIFAWAPAFFVHWDFNHIVAIRKLVPEP